MKHARDDYNSIQDTSGLLSIAEDEPVFLIRAQDSVSGDAVRAWADLAEKNGSPADIIQMARDHATKMDEWPNKKIADV